MKKTPLSMFVDTHGQTVTGKLIGMTQGGVWQALKSKREIIVVENDDGSYHAYEKKLIGKQRPEI